MNRQKRRQSSSEVYYFTWNQDDIASENWSDNSFADRPGAQKGHPYFLSLGLRGAKRPDKPSSFTRWRMNRLAKRLQKSALSIQCIWVGESRFGGEIRQYYYGEDEAAVKMMIAQSRKGWLDNRVELFLDVDWSLYYERIFPTAAQRQGMENKKIYAQLAAKGDRKDVARRINHYLAFATEGARDRFLGSARQAGFALGEPFFADEAVLPYGVYVHKRGPLDVEQITRDSTALIECAEPVEGEYLYWDCALVRK